MNHNMRCGQEIRVSQARGELSRRRRANVMLIALSEGLVIGDVAVLGTLDLYWSTSPTDKLGGWSELARTQPTS
jgi:hypothetical protein